MLVSALECPARMKEGERSDGRRVFIVETIRIPLIKLREAEDARPDGCEVRRLKGRVVIRAEEDGKEKLSNKGYESTILKHPTNR